MAITLFHLSDPHFDAADQAALAWFAGAVARERPDVVLCTGDITMRGTEAEFAAAARWFATLPAPVHVEPGNHDMPYYGEMIMRLTRPYARFARFRAALAAARAGTHAAMPEALTLVPLWTIAPAQWRLNWSKGRVARDGLRAALATLAAARVRDAAGLRLVLCHHPLIDAGTKGTGATCGGAEALAALAAAGAQAVLSGHVHDPFDRMITADGRPIRVIGAGTLSRRQRATPPSYNRLTWSAEHGLGVAPVFMT